MIPIPHRTKNRYSRTLNRGTQATDFRNHLLYHKPIHLRLSLIFTCTMLRLCDCPFDRQKSLNTTYPLILTSEWYIPSGRIYSRSEMLLYWPLLLSQARFERNRKGNAKWTKLNGFKLIRLARMTIGHPSNQFLAFKSSGLQNPSNLNPSTATLQDPTRRCFLLPTTASGYGV